MKMPYPLLFLLLIFPLGQLGRLTPFGGDLVLQINDVVVFLTLVFFFVKNRSLMLGEIKKSTLTKPLALWTATMTLSLGVNILNLSTHQLLVSSLYPLRFLCYSGLFFCFSSLDKKQKDQAQKWLLGSIFAIAVIGLLQYVYLPNVSFLKSFDWDDHYYRVVSTLLDPGFTGALLVLGLISVVWLNLKNFKRPLTYALIALIYIPLALTYSRASYLMYLVGFAVLSAYQKSVKILLVSAVLLAITIPLLPKTFGEGTKLGRENSITARIHNWRQSVQIWSQHPIFGVGFDAYRYVRPNVTEQSHSGAGADSSLLLVLATTGIIGLSAYLYLLFKIWQLSRKNALLAAAFLGIIAHSFFNNTLFYPWVLEWLWIALAVY